ncbi:MAG: AMP-binding protein, partial [Kangiellaceae bacterium]|nr:AMP-binding protein [Kangiellaceae bacterium]
MANLLHDLISISAVNQPNSIAIQEKNRSTSYAELDLITNGIANLLAEIGELPGQRIGLLVDKSIEAYQGIYAILKSGCAYVPLDKQAPAERLAYICSDCQIHTLLVTSKTWAKLKSVLACQSPIKNIVVLDEAEAEAVNGIKVFFA